MAYIKSSHLDTITLGKVLNANITGVPILLDSDNKEIYIAIEDENGNFNNNIDKCNTSVSASTATWLKDLTLQKQDSTAYSLNGNITLVNTGVVSRFTTIDIYI